MLCYCCLRNYVEKIVIKGNRNTFKRDTSLLEICPPLHWESVVKENSALFRCKLCLFTEAAHLGQDSDK